MTHHGSAVSIRTARPLAVPEGALVRELPIINRRGLHARASAKFVQTVERFNAEVTVTRCGETVGGRSIMGLLTLGAAQGTTITVTAKGQDADALPRRHRRPPRQPLRRGRVSPQSRPESVITGLVAGDLDPKSAALRLIGMAGTSPAMTWKRCRRYARFNETYKDIFIS